MEDLITWFRACLDDDEKAAKAAGGDSGDLSIFEVDSLTDWEGTGLPDAEAHHIARHDPAAVLADVAAKRAVLDLCARAEIGDSGEMAQVYLAEEVISRLASAYRNRPGFKESWGV